ncbi:MAG TPA: chain length determinant protein EpsF [Oxalicibacterium sp.]|jgi:succinoglycan biosynthesis transport protein ExoP|nr:chain length determinant protein EpsF [Oxalicibacterium sp.]
MNFTQFLLILRARYKIILGTLIVVVATTVTITMLLPSTYTATTSLVLNYKGVDPVTGLTLPSQLMPGYLATQIDILNSQTVALKVVDDLKLADSPVVKQQFQDATGGQGSIREWLANLISTNLDVEPSPTSSSVLSVNYKATDPQFAATMSNAFANAYLNTATQLKIDPSKQASEYFTKQIKVLRDNFEAAQRKLSKYQQENNIDDPDGRIGVETARLNELSSQLVQVQGAAIDANSRLKATQSDANVAPDVMNNGLIQSLKGNLLAAEAKFAEVSSRLSPNHPQYQSAKAEVDKQRANLNAQIAQASASISSNARVQQQREAEIKAALAAQRTKVMDLNLARDELILLQNEVSAAQRAYEAATNRYTQTNLEARSTQSDIAVLTPAVAPLKPSGPKVLLISLISIFLGGMLGLGLGLIAEIIDRRVRSTKDLIDVLNVPVLGVMNRNAGDRRLRLGFSRPALPRGPRALKPT